MDKNSAGQPFMLIDNSGYVKYTGKKQLSVTTLFYYCLSPYGFILASFSSNSLLLFYCCISFLLYLFSSFIFKPISLNTQNSQYKQSSLLLLSYSPSMHSSVSFRNISNLNFNFNTLKQLCSRNSITLTKFKDSQIELAYLVQGFKARGKKQNQFCYIFVSLIEPNSYMIKCFLSQLEIRNKTVVNETQAFEFIKQSLQYVSEMQPFKKTSQQQYQEFQKLFVNLQNAAEKIIKNSSSQIEGIQNIKSSAQYSAVCDFGRKCTQQVSSICKQIKQIENRSKVNGNKGIDLMLQIQKDKEETKIKLLEYNEQIRQASNVEGIIDNLIEKQKKVIQGCDFENEISIERYLQNSIKLKKLQNQKKYFSKP